jgi:kynurenine formamidase
MTNEQLKMLRSIVQGEIEAAIMAENDYRFQAWETLAQSFGHIDAPSNWHQ